MEPMKPMEGMKPLEPMKPMPPLEPMQSTGQDRWWPESLGDHPNSAGGQNQMRYAYFGEKRRLAVDNGDGNVTVYDTADHQISGVQQDQSAGGKNLAFSSGQGPVRLADLKKVSG